MQKFLVFLAVLVLFLAVALWWFWRQTAPGAQVHQSPKSQLNPQEAALARASGEDSPRKTGKFQSTTASGLIIPIDWCSDPDGTIGEQRENGRPNGVKYMRTHLKQVNADGTISVFSNPTGTVSIYAPSAVYLQNHPTGENIEATVFDLEPSDCVLLVGVEQQGAVEVYGVI